MSNNFVRILKYPLISNRYNELKKDLPDDISLIEAIHEAVLYGEECNRQPSYLFHQNIYYNFTHNGVIEMGGNKNKTCIRKIDNPYYNE